MFIIKGFHPESDSEWTEPGEFETVEDANKHIEKLPEIDCGHGHYEVWDKDKNISVDG
jgi:hypothetical protein